MSLLTIAQVQDLVDRAMAGVNQRIAQLQGALNGCATVSGLIDTASGAQTGNGFSVTKLGTGDVLITFDVPFRRQISIVAMPAETVGARAVKVKDGVATSGTGARLQVYLPDAPFAAAESIISFVASG